MLIFHFPSKVLLLFYTYGDRKTAMEEYMLSCPTKKYLGFECLGCGLQRSVLFLFKGEFAEAFFMFPAIYPLLLLGSAIVFHQFFPVKHIVKIVWILGIFSAATMVLSYVLKHFI